MNRERRIDYVEFASNDPAASRAFFNRLYDTGKGGFDRRAN